MNYFCYSNLRCFGRHLGNKNILVSVLHGLRLVGLMLVLNLISRKVSMILMETYSWISGIF